MPYRTQAQVHPGKGTKDLECPEKQTCEHPVPVVASENHEPMFGFTGQYKDLNDYNRGLLNYDDNKNQKDLFRHPKPKSYTLNPKP